MSEASKLSHAEEVKIASNYLRGTIAEELAPDFACFNKDNEVLLKTHGTYQQDDRDFRSQRTDGKKDKAYIFMVRTKIPGGKLTSDQLLAELDLADEIGNTTLRATSRQGLQLHGVVKGRLKETIRRIHDCQLSTLGACGDVNRNVMCCPAPYKNAIYTETQRLADQLADHFAPRTRGYHDIWLTDISTGQKDLIGESDNGDTEVEPIYGKQYLPRKFKMAIGFPFDNCTDIYTNDLGFLAVIRDGNVVGYNIVAGGGLGVTPSAKKTFPAIAKRIAFVEKENAVKMAEAVVRLQRDHGNREDRKVARLKYVIANWGVEKFKQTLTEYYGAFAEPTDDEVHGFDDHMGWAEQGDGKLFYGLNLENGRIKDDDKMSLKSALREICTTFSPGIRLTSHQSILFSDLAPADRPRVEAILRKHHVPLSEDISTVRRWSMACVAWPTCGLSITEAERALPGIMDQLEGELSKLGLSSERFTVRMTGCPNGCARPYNSDVGLVGKTKGKYTVLVGGRVLGNRLNFIFKDLVPEEDVAKSLVPLFVYFKQARQSDETFGDFCHRVGQADLQAFAEQFETASVS